MTSLILVKHSAPDIVASRPAAEWRLSSAGRARCASLADRLRRFSTRSIATSVEPKAVETATLVGAHLGLPIEIVQGLHEHDRRNVTLLGEDAFRATIRLFFVAAHSGEDGFALWDQLGLPSLVVLTRPGRGQDLELRRVEAAIPGPD